MERQKDPLLVLLQNRGTSAEVLSKLQNDKIDSSVITLMSDEDLAKYIPHYGDRLAAVAFCRMNHRRDSEESNRNELLEKIRENCCAPISKAVKRMHIVEKLKGNKNAKKTAKRVELGWMNFSEKDNSFKQVRSVKGGGTRHIIVDKQAKVRDIQEMAKSLFFPNGVCRSLKLTDHVCSIHDFAQNEMDPDVTVEDLYEKNKGKMLRLYLFTKRNVQGAKSFSNCHQLTSLEVVEDCPHNVKEDQGSEQEVIIDFSLLPDSDVLDLLNPQSEVLMNKDQSNEASDNKIKDEIGMYGEMDQDQAVIEVTTEYKRTDQAEGRVADIAQSLPEVHEAEMQHVTNSDDEVTVGMPFSHSADLDVSLPLEQSKPKVVIVVRVGNCLSDLLAAFLDPDIMNKFVHIKRKLPNGELEEGEGSGVVRDCLSEFWGEFYSKCTLGVNVKTPFLRHEFQVEEWRAIARILVTGWTTVRYFPLLLPLPFLEETLYGTIYSSVTKTFLQYVSKEERETLELALSCFEAVDKDDLVDVLVAHDCHQCATKDNISRLVSQLGHKTLIQTPMFVIESWRPILKILKDTLFPHKLVEIMEERIPTPKRVKQLLKFPKEMTAVQHNVATHLKRYIGESDKGLLEAFLRSVHKDDYIPAPTSSSYLWVSADVACELSKLPRPPH